MKKIYNYFQDYKILKPKEDFYYSFIPLSLVEPMTQHK